MNEPAADGGRSQVARLVAAPRFVPIVLAIGLLLRIGWIVWTQLAGVAQTSDAAWYHARAASIATGNGYAIDGMPTAYWPVGYPGFLGLLYSVVGIHATAALIANVLFHMATLWLAYLIARKLFDSERVARLALLILALHPNGIAYSSLLMSENLFIPLMLLGTWLLMKGSERWEWGIVAGIVYGAAALVKPQALPLPAITLVALWLGARKSGAPRPSWKLALAANAVMILVVLPWTLRNHGLYGKHGIISNNDGINLLIGNNPQANGAYDDIVFRKPHELMGEILVGDWDAHRQQDHVVEYLANTAARRAALNYLTEQPLHAAGRLPLKLWYTYRADTEGFSLNLRGLADQNGASATLIRALKIAAELYWIALLGAAALIVVRSLRKRAGAGRVAIPGLPVWIILYFTAIALVYFGDGRFHAPAVPFIAMIAGGMGRRDERGGMRDEEGNDEIGTMNDERSL